MSATHADITWGASLTVKQLQSMSLSSDVQIDQDRATGAVAVSATHVRQTAPKCSMTSTDLETILAVSNFATAGLHATSGIVIPLNVRAAGAAYASSVTLTAGKGLLIPVSASANQGGGPATISLEGHIYSATGAGNPWTYATSTTVAGSYNANYRFGSVTYNGSAITGAVGATVNFGFVVEPEYTDGATHPTAVYLREVNPSIDIRFRNQAALADFDAGFDTMTALVVKFLKQAEGATVSASADNITFTFADGAAGISEIPGNGTNVSEIGVRCVGEALTVSTTAA